MPARAELQDGNARGAPWVRFGCRARLVGGHDRGPEGRGALGPWVSRARRLRDAHQADCGEGDKEQRLGLDGHERRSYGTKTPWRKKGVLSAVPTYPSGPPSLTSNWPSPTTERFPSNEYGGIWAFSDVLMVQKPPVEVSEVFEQK